MEPIGETLLNFITHHPQREREKKHLSWSWQLADVSPVSPSCSQEQWTQQIINFTGCNHPRHPEIDSALYNWCFSQPFSFFLFLSCRVFDVFASCRMFFHALLFETWSELSCFCTTLQDRRWSCSILFFSSLHRTSWVTEEAEDPPRVASLSDGWHVSLIQISQSAAVERQKNKRIRGSRGTQKRRLMLEWEALRSQSESHGLHLVRQNKQHFLKSICHQVSSIDWAACRSCFIHKSTTGLPSLLRFRPDKFLQEIWGKQK